MLKRKKCKQSFICFASHPACALIFFLGNFQSSAFSGKILQSNPIGASGASGVKIYLGVQLVSYFKTMFENSKHYAGV